MSFWFAVSVFLNIFFIVFILIRDDAARRSVLKLFNWIRSKIHTARVRAKVSKNKGKIKELIQDLGRTAQKNKLQVAGIDDKMREVDALDTDGNSTRQTIDSLVSEIETSKQKFENYRKKQELRIKEMEGKKQAKAEELNRQKKELDGMLKKIGEKEKLIKRTENNLREADEEIPKIEADRDLSTNEKEKKMGELKKLMEELKQDKKRLRQEHASLIADKPALEKKVHQINPQVAELNLGVTKLQEEERIERKKHNDAVEERVRQKNQLHTKLKEIQDKQRLLFAEIGADINKQRVEHELLTPLYQQIDALNKEIKKMKEEIGEQKK